jgi:hypothetical protein
VKRAQGNDYLIETARAAKSLAARKVQTAKVSSSESVTLIDYDVDAEDKVLAAILYPHARNSLHQLRGIVAQIKKNDRLKIFQEQFGKRRHRRDKPGRAFENVYYTFDIIGNLGAYRDIHRHRILTQERQDFTTVHGYDTPQEICEAGFESDFDRCMARAADLYDKIYGDFPAEAQYVVPFAYRTRWYMKMNLREAVHLCELRTMPQGHPDYRFIAQEMWRKIQEVHPALAEVGRFIDWKSYRLGRLQSEMRTEFKKSVMHKNH